MQQMRQHRSVKFQHQPGHSPTQVGETLIAGKANQTQAFVLESGVAPSLAHLVADKVSHCDARGFGDGADRLIGIKDGLLIE